MGYFDDIIFILIGSALDPANLGQMAAVSAANCEPAPESAC